VNELISAAFLKKKGVVNVQTVIKKKKFLKGSKQHELHKYAKETLTGGNLIKAVICPKKEDLNDWLATNIVDFVNRASLIFGVARPFCTKESCSVMSAGSTEYHWVDENIDPQKALKLSAPEYMEELFRWAASKFENPKIFPVSVATPYPVDFEVHIKTICKRLFRVYGHIYYNHFRDFSAKNIEPYLNTSFKHIYLFVVYYRLVEDKDMDPLKAVIDNLNDENNSSLKF